MNATANARPAERESIGLGAPAPAPGTKGAALADIVAAIVNARSTYDGMSLADIRTAARLIDPDVRESVFTEYGEPFRAFEFPDGSGATYSDSDD